jgi:molybdopterin-guanine dinucleotide biosynthesis protein B
MRVLGIVGYSGSGKTTLIEKLIPALARRGYRVSVIKHAHHHFDVDRPGKDSHRFREAGAASVLVTSDKRWALMQELRGASEPSLQEMLAKLGDCDLVLVEGYKYAMIEKIEVHRRASQNAMLHPEDKHIVAIATDEPLATTIPQFDLNNIAELTDFIEKRIKTVAQSLRLVGND